MEFFCGFIWQQSVNKEKESRYDIYNLIYSNM